MTHPHNKSTVNSCVFFAVTILPWLPLVCFASLLIITEVPFHTKNQRVHNAARKTAKTMKIVHVCKQTQESKATTLTKATRAAKATGASKATKNNVR